MELLLTDEQTMLRDSAETFVERRGGAARMRAWRDAESKIDRAVWTAAAETGWLAVLAPESAGGLGLGLTEICLVAEELGKGLVAEPVAAAAAVARTLALADDGGARAAEVVSGAAIVLPALAESPRAFGDEPPATRAAATGATLALSGRKTGVAMAADADGFLVAATAADGLVLAEIARADATLSPAATIDGGLQADLAFDDAPAAAVAGANAAPDALAALLDALHLTTAAELLGVMETAQDITVEYLKIREQFDRPIGSFQALQHRAVDCLAKIEMCRSLVFQAAKALDAGGGSPGLASAALSKAARSALEVCKAAVQMHGGIGFTDEHDIGLYLKRAMVLSARYGNAGMHRRRYAEMA